MRKKGEMAFTLELNFMRQTNHTWEVESSGIFRHWSKNVDIVSLSNIDDIFISMSTLHLLYETISLLARSDLISLFRPSLPIVHGIYPAVIHISSTTGAWVQQLSMSEKDGEAGVFFSDWSFLLSFQLSYLALSCLYSLFDLVIKVLPHWTRYAR